MCFMRLVKCICLSNLNVTGTSSSLFVHVTFFFFAKSGEAYCYELRISFQLLFLLNLAVKYHSNCHTGNSQYFRLQYFGDQLECKGISTLLFVREILPHCAHDLALRAWAMQVHSRLARQPYGSGSNGLRDQSWAGWVIVSNLQHERLDIGPILFLFIFLFTSNVFTFLVFHTCILRKKRMENLIAR